MKIQTCMEAVFFGFYLSKYYILDASIIFKFGNLVRYV